MAKKHSKKKAIRSNMNGLKLIDRRFGVRTDAQAQHDEFSEQAEVAEILYAARKAAGLTQKQLAEATGTTQQVISQLEDADYQGHTLSMLRRVARALGSQVEIRLRPVRRKKLRVN